MKKTISAFLMSVFIVITILSSSALSADAVSKKDNVFYSLKNDLGLSTAAACGIMANIERESEFDSRNVHIDSNGLLSGGLCMWNGGRFRSLKNFCNNNGYDYLSVEGQIKYLKHELSSSYYKHIYNYLKNVSNNSSGAYDAAYYWCYYFEIPANRSSAAHGRGSLASSSYWPSYSKKAEALNKPKLTSSADGKTLDFKEDDVRVSWTSAGTSCTGYTLQFTSKNKDGKYDWSRANEVSLSAYRKTCLIKLKTYGLGTFKVRVIAKNPTKTVVSNTVTYKAVCKNHVYKTKIAVAPTEKKTGLRTYTCAKCGKVVKQTMPSLSAKQGVRPTSTAKVSFSSTKTSVTISVPKSNNISGYIIYKYVDKKYKPYAALNKGGGKVRISSLSAGKTYIYKIAAYTDVSGKMLLDKKGRIIKVATVPNEPKITSVSAGAGSAKVNWKAVSGADAYAVYYKKDGDSAFTKYGVFDKLTSVKVKGLKRKKKYYFKVKAINRSNNNAYSSSSNCVSAVIK